MPRKLPTKIAAGELRHRIDIVAPNNTQGSMGGVSQDPSQWQVVLNCWSQINPYVGDTEFAAGSFTSTASYWIVIRHPRTVTITTQMLVWFQGRTFQINAVLNPTEQTKLLILECTEINNSAQEAPTPEPQ